MYLKVPLETEPFPWLEVLSASFSGIAALGGVVALIIAIRALSVSRQSVAVDQLFVAFSELIASLQEIAQTGAKFGMQRGGERRGRTQLDEKFQRFLAARARVDLATDALGIRGRYTDGVLNVSNNLAGDVLQAEEFGPLTRKRLRHGDYSWLSTVAWQPSPSETEILARSISFQNVRFAAEIIEDGTKRLDGLVEWWGERIVEPWSQSGRSVYSIKSSYLVQTSRLLYDFTREYVQPMCEEALSVVSRGRKRGARPLQ